METFTAIELEKSYGQWQTRAGKAYGRARLCGTDVWLSHLLIWPPKWRFFAQTRLTRAWAKKAA